MIVVAVSFSQVCYDTHLYIAVVVWTLDLMDSRHHISLLPLRHQLEAWRGNNLYDLPPIPTRPQLLKFWSGRTNPLCFGHLEMATKRGQNHKKRLKSKTKKYLSQRFIIHIVPILKCDGPWILGKACLWRLKNKQELLCRRFSMPLKVFCLFWRHKRAIHTQIPSGLAGYEGSLLLSICIENLPLQLLESNVTRLHD